MFLPARGTGTSRGRRANMATLSPSPDGRPGKSGTPLVPPCAPTLPESARLLGIFLLLPSLAARNILEPL